MQCSDDKKRASEERVLRKDYRQSSGFSYESIFDAKILYKRQAQQKLMYSNSALNEEQVIQFQLKKKTKRL